MRKLGRLLETIIWPAIPRIRKLRGEVRKGFTDIDERLTQIEHRLPIQLTRGQYESLDLSVIQQVQAAASSLTYMSSEMLDTEHFSDYESFLRQCVEWAGNPKVILEFGVFSGRTIRILSDAGPSDARLYGFDSFEGLPEKWRDGFEAGAFKVSELPEVPENVTLIKGWFDEVLPDFLSTLASEISFVHVDCDLYSSTIYILEQMRDHFADECILVFDEYFNYPGWENHEHKALQEFIAGGGFRYEYIACVPSYQQVAIRMYRVNKKDLPEERS